MYGVVSKLPVSASRVPLPVVSPELSDAARACWVVCAVEGAEGSVLAGSSPVAFAEGTNHRAPSRAPAAVAVSSDRRAVDDDR